MPEDQAFDAAGALAFDKGHVVEDVASGLNGDRYIVLQWKITPRSVEACRAYVRQNRRAISNFDVEGKNYAGVWRHVITESGEIDDKDRNKAVVFKIRYARGYLTSLATGNVIDWTEARIGQGSRMSPGNTSSAGIALTQSNDPEQHHVIDFFNVAPEQADTIARSFNQLIYSNVAIEGVSAPGSWYFILASWQKEKDGSATVTVILSRPQFTLEAYQNYLTTTGSTVIYLWNVPKVTAQTIITAWRDVSPETERPGRSATASYTSTEGLVNIVLSKRAANPLNLSTDPINTSCDTVEVHHFAWGYTEAELATFITAHSLLTNHAGDSGSLTWSGRTRDIRISNRGDGLFDAEVIEIKRTYDTTGDLALNKHRFVVAEATGTKIISTHAWGWHLPKSALESVKATYEVQTVGKTNSFKVTRKDDCSFDFEAQSVAVQKISGTMTSGTEGESVNVFSGKFALAADLANILVSAARKRVSLVLTPNDDETFNYTGTRVDVQEVATSMTSGTAGVGVQTFAGRNVDVADLVNVVTSGPRVRVDINLSGNDDGTLNYACVKQTVQETAQTLIGTGPRKLLYGANTSEPVIPANHKLVGGSVNPKDDGTFDFALILKDTTAANRDTASTSGTTTELGISEEVVASNGALPGVAAGEALLAAGPRKRVRISLRPGEDGVVDYEVARMTVAKAQAESTIPGDGIIVAAFAGKNLDEADAVAAITSYSSGKRKAHNISLSGNDDGTFDLVILERESQPGEVQRTIGSLGESIELNSGRDMDAVPVIPAPAIGETVTASVRPGDDNTFSYDIQIARTHPQSVAASGGEYGQKEDITVAIDQTAPPPAQAPIAGVSYRVDVQKRREGTCDYKNVTITSQAMSFTLENKRDEWKERAGVDETVVPFRRCTAANIPTGSGDIYYYDGLSIEDDFTLSGRLVRGTLSTEAKGFTFPVGVSNRKHRIYNAGHTQYREITYTYSVSNFYEAGAAYTYISNGTTESQVYRVSAYGRSVWVAEHVTITNEGAWTNL